MIVGWAILAYSLAYVGILFTIAWWGDRAARRRGRPVARPMIYALSLAVYCTSWSFYGSVGLASSSGYGFLPIYVGPILLFTLGWPLLYKIVRVAKAQNITSIADFIAARYGKSQPVAAAVSLMALIGSLPYIALQLKAVSGSFRVLLQYPEVVMLTAAPEGSPWRDTALGAALIFALFAILFGTRHVDATEHNDGIVLAIAAEAVMKLVAFLAVGVFVTWGLFGGPGELVDHALNEPGLRQLFSSGIDGGTWITTTILAMLSVLCLPRMFHIAVVENRDETHIRLATWVFPLYLVAISLFVVPIAAAGLLLFPEGTVKPDIFVLALPMTGRQELLTVVAFIGGLSAATGMVIVSSVAVSNMVSNDLMMPLLLRRRGARLRDDTDMRTPILRIRRATILVLMLLAYLYHRAIGDTFPLASIGLLSLAAVAQFAPSLIGGLVWRGATAAGAFWGLVAGFLVWVYTLLLPSFAHAGWISAGLMETGLFGSGILMPQRLFGIRLDPFVHGAFWSLLVNVVAFVAVSLRTVPRPIERLQASAFVDPDPRPGQLTPGLRTGSVTMEELQAVVGRYLGPERAQRSFADFDPPPGEGVDLHLIRHTERLLASAIGAGSARLVMASVLERRSLGKVNALQLLDDATAAIQYNRDLLQTTIDNVVQGIAVFDKNLRLVCWNRRLRKLLDLPPKLGRVGAPLAEILRAGAARGDFGPGVIDDIVAREMERFAVSAAVPVEYRRRNGSVLEMRTSRMPGGGTVATYSDITERVRSAEALAQANENLERRVRRRTAELARAKAVADAANRDKTRFLAAASHDLLQPLNAARLYASSLVERRLREGDADLVRKLDGALASVEDLLGALLDISRLDAGAVSPERRNFRLDALFAALSVEFAPMAERRGLRLRIVPCGLAVDSDWRLLHRVLQNLLANAIRYTPRGRVLMGARRSAGVVEIQVWDTGVGIPPERQTLVFREFQRFADTPDVANGLGLGLSIVERISRILDHPVSLRSTPGKGTVFGVRVPRAQAPPGTGRSEQAETPAGPAAPKASVLCIDNDADILDGMRTLLGGWGCRVRTAADLGQARTAADAEPPDLLLVDLHLGGEADGFACVDDLRRRLHADVPAVLITADRSEAVKAQAAAAGLPLLNKPLRPAALRTLMRRLLAARRVAV
ncbi:MAG TPA: PAS domain-containing hybrid sensor histidine kinase/response regulator [Azospirillum sp.]|nr:PAS domain-containing hybrid sensor histidine kinase/response regulator [Azospirillum sp.]